MVASRLHLLLTLVGCSAATFGCNNADMDDRARNMFLDYHNEIRKSMAFGEEPNKCGNLSTGKNVYEVSWDCKLEEAAAQYLTDNNCPSSMGSFTDLGTIGQNIMKYTGSGWTAETMISTAATVLETWWSKVRTVGLNDPDNKYTDSNLYTFANMANGKLTGIGCAYKNCGSAFTVTCLYNAIGYYTNAVIYENGDPCAADADCTTYPDSTCDGGLCFKALEEADSGENTICPSNANMTDATRNKFIEIHNYLRSRGARGLEADGAGGNAPKASKMLSLTYACDLEATAQAWANNCVWEHSAAGSRVHNGTQSGENMYYTTMLNADKVNSAEDASNAWWSELLDYGVGPANNLTQEVFNRGVGHYTQMAWDTTEKIGCGVAWCSDKTFVVCQYNPTGNYLNQLIYTMGDPCTACPSGYTCDSTGGLCEKN